MRMTKKTLKRKSQSANLKSQNDNLKSQMSKLKSQIQISNLKSIFAISRFIRFDI